MGWSRLVRWANLGGSYESGGLRQVGHVNWVWRSGMGWKNWTRSTVKADFMLCQVGSGSVSADPLAVLGLCDPAQWSCLESVEVGENQITQ